MKYTVYQLSLSNEARAFLKESGDWDAAAKNPEIRAYLDSTTEGAVTQISFDEYFTAVCEIEASTLDQVFHIGNMGPESSITRLNQMRSVSVGDVIEDDQGNKVVVAPIGFEELR